MGKILNMIVAGAILLSPKLKAEPYEINFLAGVQGDIYGRSREFNHTLLADYDFDVSMQVRMSDYDSYIAHETDKTASVSLKTDLKGPDYRAELYSGEGDERKTGGGLEATIKTGIGDIKLTGDYNLEQEIFDRTGRVLTWKEGQGTVDVTLDTLIYADDLDEANDIFIQMLEDIMKATIGEVNTKRVEEKVKLKKDIINLYAGWQMPWLPIEIGVLGRHIEEKLEIEKKEGVNKYIYPSKTRIAGYLSAEFYKPFLFGHTSGFFSVLSDTNTAQEWQWKRINPKASLSYALRPVAGLGFSAEGFLNSLRDRWQRKASGGRIDLYIAVGDEQDHYEVSKEKMGKIRRLEKQQFSNNQIRSAKVNEIKNILVGDCFNMGFETRYEHEREKWNFLVNLSTYTALRVLIGDRVRKMENGLSVKYSITQGSWEATLNVTDYGILGIAFEPNKDVRIYTQLARGFGKEKTPEEEDQRVELGYGYYAESITAYEVLQAAECKRQGIKLTVKVNITLGTILECDANDNKEVTTEEALGYIKYLNNTKEK